MAGRPRVIPLRKKKSKPTWSPFAKSRSEVECHGSTDETHVMVCLRLGAWLIRSVKIPSDERVPVSSSLIAYPTQSRLSSELRESRDSRVMQVFDDLVIQIRRYWTGIFQSMSFSVAVPPSPSVIDP